MSDLGVWPTPPADPRVVEIENAPYMRGTRGRKTITAAIATLAVANVDILFDKELPTTDYSVVVGFTGADNGILGNLSAMVATTPAPTTTGCRIWVKNSALVSLGLNVVVTAVALY